MCSRVPSIVMALLVSVRLCYAVAGDLLAERIVRAYGQEFPDGTTAGATVEPGEINEAAAPAGAEDRSVWYEWRSSSAAGKLFVWVTFTPASSLKGVAAYSLASAEEPVTMSSLRPAGAAVAGAGPQKLQMRLWCQPSERIILRLWTAPAPGVPAAAGAAFDLNLYYEDRAYRDTGDTIGNPRRFFSYVGSDPQEEVYAADVGGSGGLGARHTSETSECRIGANWYSAAGAFWYEWEARHTGRFRFSLAGRDTAQARILVAQLSGMQLQLLAPSGLSASFHALAGQKYLVRVTDLGQRDPEFLAAYLLGGPAEPGDEPAEAAPLLPGIPVTVRITGASPAAVPLPGDELSFPGEPQLYPGYSAPLRPDAWFDLGTSLAGPFRVNGGGAVVTIYRAEAGGSELIPVAGGPLSSDACFLAESGRRYLARVIWAAVSNYPVPVWRVALEPAGPPPAHDRKAGAVVLDTSQLPLVIRGDATGATAEESDWSAGGVPAGRTVWYALDHPASAQPWFVHAWNLEVLPVRVFREENGTLVSAHLTEALGDGNRFTLTGSRVWLMVPANADSRFMLMAGPAVSPGDAFADPLPLTPGAVQFLYPGVATGEPDEAGGFSIWHTWTAAADGLVHFSTMGSASGRQTRIYTGDALTALSAVTTTTYSDPIAELPGRVESFQAQTGFSYRFQTIAYGPIPFAPFKTLLKPGGWDSPYDVWRQNWPAWDGVPSLDDPLADTDGDGISNLMEMAVLDTKGPVLADVPGFPWPDSDEYTPGGAVWWGERTWALRGPAGCTPFQMIGEASPDLRTWTAVHTPTPPGVLLHYRYYQMRKYPAPLPANFFRLRVHR